MADFPTPSSLPLFVHSWTRWGAAIDYRGMSNSGLTFSSALTWPVANTGFYIPMSIPWAYPVKRVFWMNGSSVASTSFDFGIYTWDGTRIYSTTSTAGSGTSVPQYTTISGDLILVPGRYYFALSCTSTTASRGGQGSTGATVLHMRRIGVLQQASVATLPANMTGAAVANSCYPICGVTRTASGF